MPSKGVQYTIVNGGVVYAEGSVTGATPGTVLRS
jgi:N-acyl-D-aspartate/D-glutamate deacylase